MKLVLLTLGAVLVASSALADDAGIPLKLKNHRFTPAEIHVKANVPNLIVMSNEDATAEEFDSTSLKVEKVVAGNSSGNVRIRPLAPGRYPFMGEYHSDTAQGVVVAE
jgi:Cupredoxin-like domain